MCFNYFVQETWAYFANLKSKRKTYILCNLYSSTRFFGGRKLIRHGSSFLSQVSHFLSFVVHDETIRDKGPYHVPYRSGQLVPFQVPAYHVFGVRQLTVSNAHEVLINAFSTRNAGQKQSFIPLHHSNVRHPNYFKFSDKHKGY